MQSKSLQRSRNRTLLSCTECHRRKQKCNRSHPCNDCMERGVPHKCHFVTPLRRDLKQDNKIDGLPSARPCYASTRAAGAVAAILFSKHTTTYDIEFQASLEPRLRSDFVGGFDAFSVLPDTTGDPLPKSTLLEYFIRQLGSWVASCEDGPPVGRPAFSWLKLALHHPPLFYATLLGAAVHLDRKQPIDKRTLIWYKIETMRLANEKMNIPNEGATDQMLIVVLILLYFNVGDGDGEEYEMHLRGINQMLIMRGGVENLGMRGIIKNWLKSCYGPWNHDWHYGLFVEFYGIKRQSPK
ncbi:beb1b999-0530-4624-af24-c03827c23f95 [Sclerotinia trifoliorum]|uniref:Beb1b999-0530-4624-af24-c03827c23f95 n=1 Tax=Sclerotinia trifoliorum TaxID=28548 RepID=A0A8H2ZW55_9HELO|nr:beb1b999-0530-4624-af24-c03827c23f95 [Sclerotinia trifoliorum]